MCLLLQVQLLITSQDVENYKLIKADLDRLRTLVEKSELWVEKKDKKSGGEGKDKKDKKDKKEKKEDDKEDKVEKKKDKEEKKEEKEKGEVAEGYRSPWVPRVTVRRCAVYLEMFRYRFFPSRYRFRFLTLGIG